MTGKRAMKYTICDHPLVQEKLGLLRDKTSNSRRFRILLEDIGLIMGLQALSALKTRGATVLTPLARARTIKIDQRVTLVAVLRAGLGMMPGLLRLLHDARVGHIGLYRDEKTLTPVQYYVRLPKDLSADKVLLLDPMLATGGSAVEAIRVLKSNGGKNITLLSLVAATDGIRRVNRDHPDVPIITAAVDPRLNENGYILPGLGDAGDRLFGT